MTFGENVRTRPIFRFRVGGEHSPICRLAQGPGGPWGRPTRIGPPRRPSKPRGAGRRPPPTGSAAASAGPRFRRLSSPADPVPYHRDQAEALGGAGSGIWWRDGAQALEQAGRALLAPPHLDQAGHQRAHHLVAERAGGDVETQQAALPRSAGRPASASPRGPRRRASGHAAPGAPWARPVAPPAPAKRAEVVAAEQDVGGGPHGHEVERVAYVPGDAGQQRIGRRRVPDQVAVGADAGRTASVEVVAHRLGSAHHDLGGQLAVQGAGEADAVEGDGREVDMDDLAAGVHAGVGAAGTGEGGRLGQAGRALEGQAQRAGHGRDLWLDGEAPEGGAVVGDEKPPALHRSAGGVLHP